MTNATADLDGVVLFDFIDIVCDPNVCAPYRDGQWWYRDPGHISVHASTLIGPALAQSIEDLL